MKNKRRGRKPEAVKAIERMNDLADAFAAASPETQQAGLAALATEIKRERTKTGKGWMTLFHNTFQFLQREGEKR